MLSLRQVINNLSFNIAWQLSFFFSLPTTTRRRIKLFPVIYKLNTAYFSDVDIIVSRKQLQTDVHVHSDITTSSISLYSLPYTNN